MKEQISELVTRKERGITVKKFFPSFILLVCIFLVFIGNVCSFIHFVGEEEYEILVSLVAGTVKKTKRGLKRTKVEIRMSESIVKHHIPSEI